MNWPIKKLKITECCRKVKTFTFSASHSPPRISASTWTSISPPATDAAHKHPTFLFPGTKGSPNWRSTEEYKTSKSRREKKVFASNLYTNLNTWTSLTAGQLRHPDTNRCTRDQNEAFNGTSGSRHFKQKSFKWHIYRWRKNKRKNQLRQVSELSNNCSSSAELLTLKAFTLDKNVTKQSQTSKHRNNYTVQFQLWLP